MLPAGFFCHACGLSLACVSWLPSLVRSRSRRKVQGVANPVSSNLGKPLSRPDTDDISGFIVQRARHVATSALRTGAGGDRRPALVAGKRGRWGAIFARKLARPSRYPSEPGAGSPAYRHGGPVPDARHAGDAGLAWRVAADAGRRGGVWRNRRHAALPDRLHPWREREHADGAPFPAAHGATSISPPSRSMATLSP